MPKRPMSVDQLNKLAPHERALAIADVLDETAVRCRSNALIAGSWVEQSFKGAAERLRELAADLKPSK